MLDALRKSASSWVAKILLGMLVLSFAVWGIADIFGNYGTQSVAKVGDIEVSTETFRAAYQRELSGMADRLGRQLTPDEARALGVDRRVLSQLVTTAALSNQARDLDLGVSDEFVAQKIVTSPLFTDAFGRFSRNLYERRLAYSGYSEEVYVAEQQGIATREQLVQSFRGDIVPPDVLVDAMHEFQGARRVADYIVLEPIDPQSLDAPGDETLRTFYSENEAQFTTPELRSLDLIVVEPAEVAGTLSVSEDDIAQEYEARRGDYETKERRSVDQILFTDPEKAAAAHERLATGADFATIAGEAGFSEADIDLGKVAQSDIVDPTIAEAAFSLGQGEISDPITGALGTAILRVREIEPASVKPLEDVHDEIREALALDFARDEVLDIADEIEDARAGGLTIAEISAQLNFNLVSIAGADRRGRDGAGEPIAELPATPELLRAAFESDVGVENDAVETPSGGFIWFDVTGVAAPELNPFESVRERVETAWRQDEAATRLREQADEAVSRGNAGISMAGLAARAGAKVQTTEPFTRRSPTTPFAPSLVEAVFAAPQGMVIRGSGRDSESQVIVKVSELMAPEPLEAAGTEQLKTQVTNALGNDIYEQYVSGLQARDGVTVNETALNTLFGDGT